MCLRYVILVLKFPGWSLIIIDVPLGINVSKIAEMVFPGFQGFQ